MGYDTVSVLRALGASQQWKLSGFPTTIAEKEMSVLCIEFPDGSLSSLIVPEKQLDLPRFEGDWSVESLLQSIHTAISKESTDGGDQAPSATKKETDQSGPVQNVETKEAEPEGLTLKDVWTAAYINNLSDSAFFYIEPGGEKDGEGKTTPRSLRHLPYRDANGKVDPAHVRNAIARAPQTKDKTGKPLSRDLVARIQARARKLLGSAGKGATMPNEAGEGYCVCNECGYRAERSSGVPCEDKTCPVCSTPLSSETKEDYEKSHRPEVRSAVLKFWDRVAKLGSRLWSKDDWTTIAKHLMEDSQHSAFFTVKDSLTGRGRWVSISSTAFLDKDSDIVPQRALEKAVNGAVGTDRGPLRFWHETGIDFGRCDFQLCEGLCLVESGLWNDDEIAREAEKSTAEHPGAWQTSIAFLYNPTTLEKDVVVNNHLVKHIYNDIVIVERSLLPSAWSSNWFSAFDSKTRGEIEMDQRKIDALAQLVGPDRARKVAAAVDQLNAQKETDGAVYKSADGTLPGQVEAIAESLQATDPSSADVLLEAVKALTTSSGPSVKADPDAALKSTVADFLADLPESNLKALLMSAMETTQDITSDDKTTLKSEGTPEVVTEPVVATADDPVAAAATTDKDTTILQLLADMKEKMSVIESDVALIKSANTTRSGLIPNAIFASQQPQTANPAAESVVKDAGGTPGDDTLKSMSEQLQRALFQVNGGISNG